MSTQKFTIIITVQRRKHVDELNKINDIIFDIDWQGNQQLSKYKNLNLIKIYITITSKKIRKRLTNQKSR